MSVLLILIYPETFSIKPKISLTVSFLRFFHLSLTLMRPLLLYLSLKVNSLLKLFSKSPTQNDSRHIFSTQPLSHLIVPVISIHNRDTFHPFSGPTPQKPYRSDKVSPTVLVLFFLKHCLLKLFTSLPFDFYIPFLQKIC